ncbi:hypothetical protein DVH24_040556 [Malus domestica]|uniref:Uncharacterized protein n=1 Tax=Malus domestica TaxID=3750 RepID=A0A498I913_MALDO|nr:hypothetical protein DVH24_040556 [Malus domestica]
MGQVGSTHAKRGGHSPCRMRRTTAGKTRWASLTENGAGFWHAKRGKLAYEKTRRTEAHKTRKQGGLLARKMRQARS